MKKWKKICCIVVSMVLVIAILCIAVLQKQIKSVNSIEKVADDFYIMNYYADYKLDKMLEQGIRVCF